MYALSSIAIHLVLRSIIRKFVNSVDFNRFDETYRPTLQIIKYL